MQSDAFGSGDLLGLNDIGIQAGAFLAYQGSLALIPVVYAIWFGKYSSVNKTWNGGTTQELSGKSYRSALLFHGFCSFSTEVCVI
jgi:hypothetical protein